MSTLLKSTALGAALLAGVVFTAQAQTGNVAALPPGQAATPPAATAPVGPSVAYPGPNPGAGYYGMPPRMQSEITSSPNYVGPSPGGGAGPTPPRFDKSADYDANTTLHPYTSSMGPRAH